MCYEDRGLKNETGGHMTIDWVGQSYSIEF